MPRSPHPPPSRTICKAKAGGRGCRFPTQDRPDIGTFERMCGIHLSLGAKHATYNKPQIRKRSARFHVDVFAITEAVLLDGESVYSGGGWRV